MSRDALVDIAKENMALYDAQDVILADDLMKIPADIYTSSERFEEEKNRIFKRMPLVLAPTAELPNKGDYKAMKPAGVPILLTRGDDGVVRAFMNACGHRGAQFADVGTGNTKRFTCPYHGWTYNRQGELVGIASKERFGEIDEDCYALAELPVLEKAGLIFGILDPKSDLDIETFLSGYEDFLAHFGFENWTLFESRTIEGPNWKVAYDGYLDYYHLPVLHKNTIGGAMSPNATYYSFGPHTHVTAPERFEPLRGLEEKDWPMETLLIGVWTIFPHISIASFQGGGRSVMLSQLFPGDEVGTSYTTQYYLMENAPSDEQRAEAHEQFDLLETVVLDEDYWCGKQVQEALASGARDHVLFGRNEGGGQVFHGWVQKIVETEDDKLNELFEG